MKPARRVTIEEAQADFEHLLELVQKGEEIILLDAGRPVAKLVAFESQVETVESEAFFEEDASAWEESESSSLLPKNAHFFFED